MVTVEPADEQYDHRWSGWPGAWCLDCGTEDLREVCVANCKLPSIDDYPCPIHSNESCPERGSHRYDPYYEGGM